MIDHHRCRSLFLTWERFGTNSWHATTQKFADVILSDIDIVATSMISCSIQPFLITLMPSKNTTKFLRYALIALPIVFISSVEHCNIPTLTRDNAGLQGHAGATSGFFDTSNPVNYPSGAQSWWHLLDVRHHNIYNNFAMQFAGNFYDQEPYFRKTAAMRSIV